MNTTQHDEVMKIARAFAYGLARHEGVEHVPAKIHSLNAIPKEVLGAYIDWAYDYLGYKNADSR